MELCNWAKKKNYKNRLYIYVIAAFLNEVSLLHTKFSIQCCGLCFLTNNTSQKAPLTSGAFLLHLRSFSS